MRNGYLVAQYRRLPARRGHAKALTAVGHSILTAVWHMLKTGELYRDLGDDYFTRQDPTALPNTWSADSKHSAIPSCCKAPRSSPRTISLQQCY